METSTNVISIVSYLRAKSSSSASDDHAPPRTATVAPHRFRRTRTAPSTKLAHEDDIIERATMGDLDAAAELRARYIRGMRRAARDILVDEREARRAADSALEEACSGWPPERGRVDRWLLRLARRAAVARRKTLWGLGDSHEPERRPRRLSQQRLVTSRHESSN
jgi:hypothetical protein